MFEISGGDIADLNDGDLRALVARLAVAELRAKGYPLSSITAGGNQDAADGGLDVRIECPSDISNPDFVPRRLTGFQVKKPDMPPSAIGDEMRPEGSLRDVIRDLAEAAGAYVIVSSHGSVADKPLTKRREAMRTALNGLSCAAKLHTDFYDRDRLATWTNEYPGVAIWVRSRVGRPLSGWSGIGNWAGQDEIAPKPYLSNDKACLIDERSRNRDRLPITEGIARLRASLRESKQCIRLVGLSGLGKTRLVQALFEANVGNDPLDSSLAVYTDYSDETNPTARDMARELIAHRKRAILVVDNCNPATHSELARLCSNEASQISLITVEYDVRDDEPEQTGVFRLQSASPELVTEWIKQTFPAISQADRDKIAEFSDGNFRVARALAETIGRGETLGRLKNNQLFERIFRQRNEPNRELLQCAEDLSLLYSIDGEDASDEGELARVGAIRNIATQTLYEALVEMRHRGVVQARGRFRAILPQAIANPLAAHALDRIPPTRFDQFCRNLTPRMLKSVSRRIGFLHDSSAAQAAVKCWLRTDGPLGDLIKMGSDGFRIITNIAPTCPEAVLTKLEQELSKLNGDCAVSVTNRDQWIRLIKAIGYDPSLFNRSVMLLTRFITGSDERNHNDVGLNAFNESFHIFLSGTQAPPEQRHALIKSLIASGDPHLIRCGYLALRALIKTGQFMSMTSHDFGARSRDWGWHPKLNKDVWDWLEEAIRLVVELMPERDARVLLADNVRGLWHYPGCRAAIDRVATVFAKTSPWIEGWIACRATLRYEGKDMPENVRADLEQLIKRLKPTDLLHQARAVVLNRMPGGGGWDFADGEDDQGKASEAYKKADIMAQDIGRALATDAVTRAEFLIELLAEQRAARAFECGRGLAEGATDLSGLWHELVATYSAVGPDTRNATTLAGFIYAAHQRDPSFTSHALEAAITNADLLPNLPYLQARAGIDTEGIERLKRAISSGGLLASDFHSIANGCVSNTPPGPLAALLDQISTLPGGVTMALEILHMHFFSQEKKPEIQHDERLVSVGRELMVLVDFKKNNPLRDYSAQLLVGVCLAGENGKEATAKICSNLRSSLDSYLVSSYDVSYTLGALFETHPLIALDQFLLSREVDSHFHLFEGDRNGSSAIEKVDPLTLQEWSNIDPNTRYPILGKCLRMFPKDDDKENTLSPLFLSILEQAPDKLLFFGNLLDRLHPRSWSGSLADILIRRKEQLLKFAEHPDEPMRALFTGVIPELDRWIEHERGRDRRGEESFE